jgi:TATA-box binding protein (TBP) (component of TFIID and TFIIIB)
MRVAAKTEEYDPEFFSGLFSALDELRVWLEN